MDPDIIQRLNEQLREMNDLLSAQTSILSAQAKAINNANSAIGNKIVSSKNTKASHNESDAAITGNTRKMQAATAATEKVNAASLQFNKALGQGKDALLGFAGAVVDVTPGMQKYAEGAKGVTGALGSVAEIFGPLGKVASLFLRAIGGLTGEAFKYSDALVKGYDDIAQAGGVIGSSAEGIMKLGHRAGLSSQSLPLLTKNVAALGENILSLGKTTSGGVDTFGRMIAVGDKTLQQYRKMGYSQERLIESQAKYVELQAQAGAIMKGSPQQLQKASLKYIDNLNVLSELTGLNEKKQQELLAQAQAQENFNAHISELEADKAAAMERGDTAEAERIQSSIDAKKEYAMFAQQFGPEKAKGILESISTKGDMIITESNAPLLQAIPGIQNQVKKLNQGVNQTGALMQSNTQGVDAFKRDFGEMGTAFGAASREAQKVRGQDNESRILRAKYGDMTEEEFNKERERLKKEQDAKKNETNGAVAQRAAIESQERALRIKFDGIMAVLSGKLNAMVLKFIPMVTNALSFITNNMPVIEGAFKALAIAIGVLAGAAGIGKVVSTVRAVKDGINKIFGRDSGPIGSPGNPAHIKFSDGLPDLPGGSGGKIATKAKYFGMTKKEYQENLKKALLSGKSKAQFREEADVLYKKLLGAGLITKSGHRTNKPWFDVDAPNSVIEKATAPVRTSVIEKATAPVQSGVITKTTAPVQARAIGKTKSPVQARAIGKTKSPVQPGESVGGALGELVDSLKYASKNAGAIIKGGAALGTALVAVGGGAAGAIWIVGKALPTFAKGMQSFNDVNGKNLAGVGIGLAGIGAGILELGAGTVFDAINGLAGVFGVKSPLERAADQLIAFQKLPINAEKVKANGEASMAFAKALAGATVINEFSEVASSISDFFKKEPPFQKFVYFSNLDINAKKTKNNATAFRYFADAMASYTGTSAVASFSNALSDATVRFFKASPPLEKFAYFSKLDINAKKTKNNATAFRYFSEALNQYKGVGTNIIGELSNLIGSAINKLFNQEGPIDAFENFTKRQFGSNGSKNAEAFFKFATSIGLLMGTASSNSWGDIGSGLLNVAGEVVGTAAGAIGGVVGGVAATVGGLLGKIIKAESGGNPNAAAKTSSAYGLGQFTKGTFEGIAKEKGSPVYGVTWEQYKKDTNIQMKALEYLTTKNQQFLRRSGIPVTSASTYLAHFLGPGGARNIYKYPDNAALNQVVGAAAYNANRSVFDKAKTVGGLKAWASKKMGDPVRQAKEGGIFTGPKSGYPMELHGTEIVIPMDRNSLLTKLSQNNANNMEAMITAMNAARENASAASGMPMPSVDNLVADRVIELDNEMRNLLLVKLNRMITVLDGRHDTAKRILRNVKA